LDNLLSNSVKYSPPDSSIRVRLCRNGDYAELDIQDQGPGIAELDRDRIFEAFHQGEPPAAGTGPVKGSGLGLSLARHYVESHEGRIEIVDSDEGAHFRVCIPRHGA